MYRSKPTCLVTWSSFEFSKLQANREPYNEGLLLLLARQSAEHVQVHDP